MITMADFNNCPVCNKKLSNHFYSFDRHVEVSQYKQFMGSTSLTVLRSEPIAECCSAECAWSSIFLGLAERGLKLTGGGVGPIEVCAKCGGPVDMSEPHVSYVYHDQTFEEQPWLSSITVHYAEGLADVCIRCDGDVAADELNLPEPVEDGEISVESQTVA
jgi:hypothetical protein